ncbi:hypothetical protein B0H21DRAFT_748227 [Amylocystis lapponica]|nr:hypothetical protein B0H21DRAFT_748227 [Amylocystis lapponica]
MATLVAYFVSSLYLGDVQATHTKKDGYFSMCYRFLSHHAGGADNCCDVSAKTDERRLSIAVPLFCTALAARCMSDFYIRSVIIVGSQDRSRKTVLAGGVGNVCRDTTGGEQEWLNGKMATLAQSLLLFVGGSREGWRIY